MAQELVRPRDRRSWFGTWYEAVIPVYVPSLPNAQYKQTVGVQKKHRDGVAAIAEGIRHVRFPRRVVLQRAAPGDIPLDSDNLVASFKHIRDAIAAALERDDADWKPGALIWEYAQRKTVSKYGVDVLVCGTWTKWRWL